MNKINNFEEISSRRNFITVGASSAAILLGGSAIAHNAGNTTLNTTDTAMTVTHNNVKNMQADDSLNSGDIVITLGYHQPGDDGDNIYAITTDNSAKTDGGSIINLYENKLKARALFSGGVVRVEQFGAIGSISGDTSTADNTDAMHRAHSFGHVVHYGAKNYQFNRLEFSSGGIVGDGDSTVLVSTDTSKKDVIIFRGMGDSALQNNEMSGLFKGFYLRVCSESQKQFGAGIKLESGSISLDDFIMIKNVRIENIPTSIHAASSVNYSIKDSALLSYSMTGILMGLQEPGSERRDTSIENNLLRTKQTSTSAIKYLGGNAKIVNNKIIGGTIGIDLSLDTPFPVIYITGNNIVNQSEHNIRIISKKTFNQSKENGFSQVLVSQNRLASNQTKGAAIFVSPTHFTLEDLSVNNNLIRFEGGEKAIAAIDISNTSGFMINNNTINCYDGKGYRGIHISQNCSSGILSTNHVVLPLNGHTLNLSTTTTEV